MASDNHNYNIKNGRDTREFFNSEINQNLHWTNDADRQAAQERVDTLIETTRRQLESE